MYYKRFEKSTFIDTYEECLKYNPNGVIVVPSDLETTKGFTDKLHERNIPFILLDSYMPDLKPLSFLDKILSVVDTSQQKCLCLLLLTKKKLCS